MVSVWMGLGEGTYRSCCRAIVFWILEALEAMLLGEGILGMVVGMDGLVDEF